MLHALGLHADSGLPHGQEDALASLPIRWSDMRATVPEAILDELDTSWHRTDVEWPEVFEGRLYGRIG